MKTKFYQKGFKEDHCYSSVAINHTAALRWHHYFKVKRLFIYKGITRCQDYDYAKTGK